MPEMDGIALTKELLNLYPEIPIMVMTGYSEKYPPESVLTAGARDFIGKPFSYNEFVLRFNKMMTDHEISLEIESKQREILIDIQKQSSDKINELQREIETIKSRLSDKE
jgi:FixJ family two-component response regulator